MTDTHHKVNKWTINKAAAVRVAAKRLGRKCAAESIEFWDMAMTKGFDLGEHMITGNGPIRCVLCGEAKTARNLIEFDNLGYCPTCTDITQRLVDAMDGKVTKYGNFPATF